MTIHECILYYLSHVHSTSAKLDIEVLLSHALQCDRSYLRAHPEDALTKEQLAAALPLLDRRVRGEPVAYILQKKEFYGLTLYVNPDVLIPRPDTEVLVDAVLTRMPMSRDIRALDVGTGSGAIAFALQSQRPHWMIMASDHSDAALAVAKQNARQLQYPIHFLKSDWFFDILPQSFEVIVSNPPYIALDDVHLTEGDVRFEPLSALVAMQQGLADLDTVIDHAKEYLVSGGLLAVEHGMHQANAVAALFHAAQFSRIETLCDMEQRPRVTLGFSR